MEIKFKPLVINYLIEKKEISKNEFCRKFNISYSKYQHWFRSPSTMKVDDLMDICLYFKVSPDVFFIEKGEGIIKSQDIELSNSNELMMAYIKQSKDEIVNYERKISEILLSNQKKIYSLNEQHNKEIAELKAKFAKEKKLLENENSRLRKSLISRTSMEIEKASEDKNEYKKTEK